MSYSFSGDPRIEGLGIRVMPLGYTKGPQPQNVYGMAYIGILWYVTVYYGIIYIIVALKLTLESGSV